MRVLKCYSNKCYSILQSGRDFLLYIYIYIYKRIFSLFIVLKCLWQMFKIIEVHKDYLFILFPIFCPEGSVTKNVNNDPSELRDSSSFILCRQ